MIGNRSIYDMAPFILLKDDLKGYLTEQKVKNHDVVIIIIAIMARVSVISGYFPLSLLVFWSQSHFAIPVIIIQS